MVNSEIATQSVAFLTANANGVDVSDAAVVLVVGTGSLTECDTAGGTYTAVDAADIVAGGSNVKCYIGTKQFIKTSAAATYVVLIRKRHCPQQSAREHPRGRHSPIMTSFLLSHRGGRGITLLFF